MIIGMSAGQGQGKSTLINEMCKIEGVRKLDLQTSREALADWGYTLDEVNRYLPLKKQFQEELFRRHTEALDAASGESERNREVLFVERTFSDIFAYTALGLGAFNQYSEWLSEYKVKCIQAQSNFEKVVFLTGRTYVPEDDGVRSTNTDFSDTANFLIEKYTHEFSQDEFNHVATITVANFEARTAILTKIVKDARERY